MPFDIAQVRAQYPALTEGFAHFDAPAGSFVAAQCGDAIAEALRAAVTNRTSTSEPGRRALRIVAEARQSLADLLGADADAVVFGPSATALTYLVARTLSAGWGPGDEVVVSRLDHDANVRPWLQVAARCGATVRWAEFDPETGLLPAGEYEHLVNERTRLVAVTAASNAIGTRPDVTAIARIAHAAGALIYVDGVRATPHGPTDVAALGADFYVTSAYKWSGPHLAACVAAPGLWDGLWPEKLRPTPDTAPDRFEYGTPSFELLAGVTGAVDHLAGLAGQTAGNRRDRLVEALRAAEAYEKGLFDHLLRGLAEIDAVTLLAAPPDRCPMVAFRLGDQHPAVTARRLGDEGVCVRAGDYYAYEYFSTVGLHERGGAVRVGIYHYNTIDEIERLLAGLKRCL